MIRAKLELPSVTLCAVTSVNLHATLAALRASLDQVDFADCLLLTDAELVIDDPQIRIIRIARLNSSREYSNFMLEHLADHIQTTHCLVVQWDGFVLEAGCWEASFLTYDYVGAPWPQFDDDRAVGNGGFSLRSRRLLDACRDPTFRAIHPEDLAICQANRPMLESRFGMRFADRDTAGRFAHERTASDSPTFGFHGIFNMISAIGSERFWELYTSLDDQSTAFVDYRSLMSQLGRGRVATRRRWQLTMHWLAHLLVARSPRRKNNAKRLPWRAAS